METNKIILNINDLKPGMVTTQEIISDYSVLVAKGVVLTEEILENLKRKYIFQNIEVYSTDDGVPQQVPVIKKKTIEDIELSFDEFSIDAKYIFDNLFVNYINSMDEIRMFVKKIQDQLDYPGIFIKDIVLYGSKSDVIYRHFVNVAALSSILGGWIGLNETELNLLTFSAILHDYGKTKINEKLLNKVEKLSFEELKKIKYHTVLGYQEIKKIPFLDPSVSYGVLMHHERLDGSGYPFGVKEEKIHKFAKIIAIADIFDAINSNRLYKKSRGPLEVLEIIHEESLGKIDYEYSKIFLDHIVNYYLGEKVLLNNKEVCRIVQIHTNDLSRPLLLSENGFIDLRKEPSLTIKELILDEAT